MCSRFASIEYGAPLALRRALLEVDGDAVLVGVREQLLARQQVPFAPRRDDADVRLERVRAELEADLVVALAGGAVRDRVGAGLRRDLDEPLGDQRARDRRAEQVLALVDGIGAEHRKHEVADEFLAQVLDVDVLFVTPSCSALARAGSTSSPWPMSAVNVTTSQPYVSCSHFRITDVSSPPEYASTTFLMSDMCEPFNRP